MIVYIHTPYLRLYRYARILIICKNITGFIFTIFNFMFRGVYRNFERRGRVLILHHFPILYIVIYDNNIGMFINYSIAYTF